MSTLKPHHSIIFGICLTAKDWARNAIGSDHKIIGTEGFENFCSGEWRHYRHYKFINKDNPEYSQKEAIGEMAEMRESLLLDIESTSVLLDNQIKRLAKMEEQMKEVMES